MIKAPSTISENFFSWVHFGDLHIRDAQDDNYLDFVDLIEQVNGHLAGEVDFAFLPGDNADDGSEAQYMLVRKALATLNLPFHIITGDHDRKSGSLDLFRKYLESDLYRAADLGSFRLLFLNAMDGTAANSFDFGSEQIDWLKAQLADARSKRYRPVVFTHLIRDFQAELVEMGHTHYNELANDGHTIYAATRSTGQNEEGPPGFSFTTMDDDVVNWKFKELGPWPFVMITSPSDEKLITRPESLHHVVRGTIPIRAKVWGSTMVAAVTCSIDNAPEQAMEYAHGHWNVNWDSSQVPDGIHPVVVRVIQQGAGASDEISILVNQAGHYTQPPRSDVDYENSIGAYPAKGILGTQLGPNENGTKGPWPSWRGNPRRQPIRVRNEE
ncbi:MAG: metallophosphoesterase [Acidobacteriota bacterium]|nr:metallophosphoesterase [Acidobacteriota bacterium]